MTYDIIFQDEFNSDRKGFKSTLQECLDYVKANNGTDNSYFADYKGGTVQVICNETQEVAFETKVE